ncbi:MAG: bifunctional hydroxymethylpyrimidine kinase/phosphomethylpyrimidine kinase, partial [Lactococcus sp.]|nr:bifunctional hydroxymethylpyrimidine kinase/phosphomethylpyrimidine kinase [Lactococcus sp.]
MTEKLPKVLAISGSDILSGGGFQADLATYSQYGIFGFVAITSIVTTTQDGDGFVITATASSLFQQQLDSLADIAFDAIKIGLLPSVEIAELTLAFIKQHQEIPIILDPVLVFKENNDHEMTKMKATLLAFLPYVTVITPNLREAAILTGMPIDTPADMET